MLRLIDKLAGKWLDMRMAMAARRVEDAEITFEANEEHVQIIASHSLLWHLASDAAGLLKDFDAENYVQFDMMPRPDRGIRPVRVTVKWAKGMRPSEKAARLEDALSRALEALYEIASPDCPLPAQLVASETAGQIRAMAIRNRVWSSEEERRFRKYFEEEEQGHGDKELLDPSH